MKKRLISALLALSMIFSIIPTTLAAPNTVDTGSFADTNGLDPDNSPIMGLSFDIEDGVIKNVKALPNTTKTNTTTLTITLALNLPYKTLLVMAEANESDDETDPDPYWNWPEVDPDDADEETTDYDKIIENLELLKEGQLTENNAVVAGPFYQITSQNIAGTSTSAVSVSGTPVQRTDFSAESIISTLAESVEAKTEEEIAQLKKKAEDAKDDADETMYTVLLNESGETLTAADLTQVPLGIFVIANSSGGGSTSNYFYYSIPVNPTKDHVEIGGDPSTPEPEVTPTPTVDPGPSITAASATIELSATPAPGATISDITATLTAATGVDGKSTNDTVTITWKESASASGPWSTPSSTKFLGNKYYQAEISLTADSTHVFSSGGATITDVTTTESVGSGDSANIITLDTVFGPISHKIKEIKVNGTTSHEYTAPDTYAWPADLEVYFVYEDGTDTASSPLTTASDLTSNDFTITYNGLSVGGAIHTSNSGTAVTITYKDTDNNTVSGITKTFTIDTITVTGTDITDVVASVTAPVPGATPNLNATTTGSTYTVEGDSGEQVIWTDEDDTNFDQDTDTFQYGHTYTATVKLNANEDYQFADTLTSAKINSTTATVDEGEGTTQLTISRSFTIDDISLTGGGDLDYYNNYATTSTAASAVVIVNDMVTDDTISKVYLNNVELGSGDYTVGTGSDINKITINAAAMKKAITEANAKTSLPTAAADSTKWAVKVTTTKGGEKSADLIKPYNTTPYLTTSSSDGTISVSGSPTAIDTGVYALAKGTEYTLTYTPTVSTHVIGTTWSVSGISVGTDSGESGTNDVNYKFTPQDGDYNISASASKQVATGQKLNVTATHGSYTISPPPEKSGSDDIVYADQTYTITATADSHYKYTSTSGTNVASGASDTPDSSNDKEGTYTFKPDGSTNDVAITVTFAERDHITFALAQDVASSNPNYDSTYQAAAGGTIKSGSSTAATSYTIYDDDTTTYTISQTPNGDSVFVDWTSSDPTKFASPSDGFTLSATSVTSAITAGATSGDTITLTATYRSKKLPSWTTPAAISTVYSRTKNATTPPSDIVYTVDNGEYGAPTIDTMSGLSAQPTISTTGTITTITIPSSVINSNSTTAKDGYNVALNYSDMSKASDFKTTVMNRSFNIKGPITVTAVTMPTGKTHGDAFDAFSFTTNETGTPTYTYTASTGNWTRTGGSGTFDASTDLPTVKVNVSNSSGTAIGTADMSLDDFISSYVTDKHLRYKTNSTGMLANGDKVQIAASTETPYGTIGVGQMDINITATATDFDKTYNNSDAVEESDLSWTLKSGSNFISADSSIAATDVTISGKYNSKNVAYTGTFPTSTTVASQTITFTASGKANTLAENYKFTVDNGTGTINPVELKIASLNNIPSATQNITSTGTDTVTTATFKNDAVADTGSGSLVGSDTGTFTYTYTYASVASVTATYNDVDITGIQSTDGNYKITPASLDDQTGAVNEAPVWKIEIVKNPQMEYDYGVASGDKKETIDLDGMEVNLYYGTESKSSAAIKYTYDANTAVWKATDHDDIAYATMPVSWTGGSQVAQDNLVKPIDHKDNLTSETFTVKYDNTTGTDPTATTTDKVKIVQADLSVEVDETGMTTGTDNDSEDKLYDATDDVTYLYTYKFTGVAHNDDADSKLTFTADADYEGKDVKWSGTDVADQNITFSNLTLGGDNAYNYNLTTAASALSSGRTGKIKPLPITITAITVPSIKKNAAVVSGTKTYTTDGKGGTQGTAPSNGITAALPSAETGTIEVKYSYAYTDTQKATAGTYNGSMTDSTTGVPLTSVELTTTHTNNKNYTLVSTGTNPVQGTDYPQTATGTVIDRTVTGITITSGTPTKRGTSTTPLKYGDTLDLSGLEVTVSYTVGSYTETEKYQWTGVVTADGPDKGKNTWDLVTSGNDPDETYGTTTSTGEPFKLNWTSTGSPAVTNGEQLSVAMNGKSIRASIPDTSYTSDSLQYYVDPVTISKIVITGLDSPYSVSKVYDGNDNVDTTGWTYALDFTKVNNTDTVTLDTSSLTVKYDNANVHTDENLKFAGWALSDNENGNYVLAADESIVLENEDSGSYTTITPTGTITQRYIKVTAVNGIQAIDEYDGNYNTAKNVTGENTATFAALDATDVATLTPTVAVGDTGIVNSDKPYIKYSYVYDRSYPYTTSSDNKVVSVSSIDFDNTPSGAAVINDNYKLFNATISDHVGTIRQVSPTSIEITPPAQMYKTGTAPDVQYKDSLTMTDLTVEVTYTATKSTVFTLQSDGTWKDNESTPNSYAADGTGLPFSFAWSDSKTYATGTTLEDVGTFTYTATLSSPSASATKTSDTAYLKVNPRKVKVTASGSTTKVYDGTTGSDGTGITLGVDFGTKTGNEAASFTAISGIKAAATTFTYNDHDVEDATTVTIMDLSLAASTGSTETASNYEVDTTATGTLTADGTITKRPVKVTEIKGAAITEVNQYATLDSTTENTKGTIQVTSADTTKIAFANTDSSDPHVVYGVPSSGDAVKIKFDYAYNDTSSLSPSENVDITFDGTYITDENPNYTVDTSDVTKATKAPAARKILKIEITKLPKTFQSDAYYKDTLNMDEMEVTLTYDTSPQVSETYTASVSGSTVTWSKGGSTVTTVPFSIEWKNTSNGQHFDQDEVLSVDKHDDNIIVVTSTEKDKNGNTVKDDDDKVDVKPLTITKIEATKKASTSDIKKEYDNSTSLDKTGETTNHDKLEYTYSYKRGSDGEETALAAATDSDDIAALDADIKTVFVFDDKDASADETVADKDITFQSAALSSVQNYEIASSPTLTTSVQGIITKKEVTIDTLYIPTAFKNSTEVFNYTASDGTGTSANTVKTTGLLDDGNAITFGYTVTYDHDQVTADTPPTGDVDVTITAYGGTGNSDNGKIFVTGTGSGNYKYTENFTAKGRISGDDITEVLWFTGPTKKEYTHGDVFNPMGMKILVKSNDYTSGITYEVINLGDDTTPNYAWAKEGESTATTLLEGAHVTVGDVELTTNDNLNTKAQYIKMGGNSANNTTTDIPVVLTVDGKPDLTKRSNAENSSDALTLNKRELEFSIKGIKDSDSTDATISKQYDGTQDLPDGYSLVPDAFTTGKEIQTIGTTEDKVDITITGQYQTNENVTGASTDSPAYTKKIEALTVTLSNTDAANYYVSGTDGIDSVTNKEIDGVLEPYKLTVTAIASGVIDNTYYGVAKDNQTVSSTDKYTSNIDSDNKRKSLKPAITFKYSYGDLKDTIASSVNVPIDTESGKSTIALATASDNFVIDETGLATTAPGAVIGDIESITVSGDEIKKIYGDKLTATDLAGLKATIIFADGSTSLSDVAYGSTAWDDLGLALDDTAKALIEDNTTLRTTHSGDNKIKVKKSGVESTNGVKLTVAQRPILLDVNSSSDLEMTYNGSNVLTDQSTADGINSTATKYVTLKVADGSGENDGTTAYVGDTYTKTGYVADDNHKFYGLADGDTLTGTPNISLANVSFTFDDANVAYSSSTVTTKDLNLVALASLMLTGNADQYAPELKKQSGKITQRTLSITPLYKTYVSDSDVTVELSTATALLSSATVSDYKAQKAATNVGDKGVSVDGIVEADKAKLSFTYKFTVPASKLGTATTVTQELATGAGAPTLTGDAAGNYSPSWNDASITVIEDSDKGITITTAPDALSVQKYYGDTFGLKGMVVTVKKAGTTYTFTYDDTNKKWTKKVGEGTATDAASGEIVVKLETHDEVDLESDILSVDYDGEKIVVTSSILEDESAKTSDGLQVDPRPITLTAKIKSEKNLNKVYDGGTTANADNIEYTAAITDGYTITGSAIVSGDTADYSALTYDYYESASSTTKKSDANNSGWKVKNSGGAVVIENADSVNIASKEYAITGPSNALDGTITPYPIVITVNTDSIPSVFKDSTADADLEKQLTISSIDKKADTTEDKPSDWNAVTNKLTAHIKYTSTQAANNADTVINDLVTYAKYDGGDIDDLTNYSVEISPDKVDGKVVDNQVDFINIIQQPTAEQEYEHGDALKLAGTQIIVRYTKPADDKVIVKAAGSDDTDLWNIYEPTGSDKAVEADNAPNTSKEIATGVTTAQLASVYGIKLGYIEKDDTTTQTIKGNLITAKDQLKYSERVISDKQQSIIAYDTATNKKSETTIDLTVSPKTITAVTTDYALKDNGVDKYEMKDITKPYDGNGTIDADHQKMIAYTPTNSSEIAVFDGTADTVVITGTARYKSNERDGDSGEYYDAGKNKAIEITDLELPESTVSAPNDNANYVLKLTAAAPTSYLDVTLTSLYADANIPTSQNVTGQITQRELTYKVTSVPSVAVNSTDLIKDANVELTSGTIVAAEQTGFKPPIKGKYDNADTKSAPANSEEFTVANTAEEKTAAETANKNVVYVDADGAAEFPYANYSFTLTGDPKGNITSMTVYGVGISTPLTVQHGDKIDLTGTVVTVKYANNDSNNYVYTYTPSEEPGETDKPWVLVKADDIANATRVAAPDDVVLIWGSDAEAASPTQFANGDKVRADDTDKAITGTGPWTAKATVYAAEDKSLTATDDVTITKKQLSLTLTGKVTKKYDGESELNTTENATILGDTYTALSGVDSVGGNADKVELDTVALSYTGTGDNHAGVTTADDGTGKHPALTVGTVTIKGDDAKYYKAPVYSATADENFVTNNTEGQIDKRPIKITSITKNMDAAVGAATKTGTLHKLGESSSNGYAVTVGGEFKDILSTDKIWIKVNYEYDGDVNTEQPDGIDVVWTNPGLEDDATELGEDNNDDAANYAITYDLAKGRAVISNGAVTSVVIEDGGQIIGYTHGDKLDMSDLSVTLNYANGNSNKYEFNEETGKWKLYRNGSATAETTEKVLADEGIKLYLGSTEIKTDPVVDTETPANDTRTVVRFAHNEALLTAVYNEGKTDEITSETDNPQFGVSRKTINVTVTASDVSQPYAGADNKALTAANLEKIVRQEAAAVNNEIIDGDNAVFAWSDTITASFTNGNVKVDETDNERPAIAQEASLDSGSYTFTGSDIGNYIITVTKFEGVITPFEFEVTKINNIPPAKLSDSDTWSGEGAETTSYVTEAELPDAGVPVKYDYTYDSPVEGEDNTHPVTVDPDTITIGGTAQQTKDNYKVTYNGSSTGVVNEKTATEIEILTQPGYITNPTDGHPVHRDTLNGAGGLEGFKFKITYEEGSDETEDIYVYHDGAWNKADNDDPDDESKYTPLTQGLPSDIQLTWDNTNTPMNPESSTILRGSEHNQITVSSTTTNDPTVPKKTTNATAEKKPIKLTAAGTFTRDYDATDTIKLDEAAPEITVSVAPGQLGTDEDVTVTATPKFKDANVNKNDDGEYEKDIIFTNVSLSGEDADNYVIEPFDEENDVEPIKGKIEPMALKVKATDAGIKTSNTAGTVDRSGVGYSDKAASGKFTVDGMSGISNDLQTVIKNLTIKYTGTYPLPVTTGDGQTVTITSVEAEGENADNFAIEAEVTGEVTRSGGSSGGGGGGGSVNTLTIHYENEDGTAGEDVSKIEAPLGTDPADLIGVFKTNLSNKTVLWTSDNEAVATVDENGVVTFVGEGTATITATSQQNKQLTDTVKITVTAPAATPTPAPTSAPVSQPTPTPGYIKTDSLITKDMLNPYIVGYDDYVFGPELPISREELAAIFARLIANNLYMDKDYDTSFPDVPEKWSKSYIGYLEGFNVVTGYEDGMFRPENYITRAEMAVMMAKAEGYDISGYMSPDEVAYADVDEGYSTWAATKAIKILTDQGIMQGYPDGTFRPGQPITRAETVATVNRVLSAQEVASYDVLPSDVTDAHWAYNDIVFAMNHRILKDAAADPNAFIWSEQFDANMVTITERVEGETVEVTDTDSASSEDASSDEAETSAEDAAAPEATEEPTASDDTTTE